MSWKPEYQELLEAVALKATQAEGDPFKILDGALDDFFADTEQRRFKYSPSGLNFGFDTYAVAVLEREAEAFKAQKRAKRDAELAAIDAAILAKDAAEKAARRQNGWTDGHGRKPMADPLAEIMRSFARNAD